MSSESKWITSGVILIVVVLAAVGIVYMRPGGDLLNTVPVQNLITPPTTEPEGLVVLLNDGPGTNATVNYVSPTGSAARTRGIPNVSIATGQFQVVRDDVFVYTDVGDEPGMRRMDESGSMSLVPGIDPTLAGVSDFWLVAPAGDRVAWSVTTSTPGQWISTLFSARIDGTDQQKLAVAEQPADFYIRPVHWAGSEVWYVRQPLGLGGYILYADPYGPVYQGEFPVLADPDAISDIAPSTNHFTKIVLRDLGLSLVLNTKADQPFSLQGAAQAGQALLSPTEQFIAVAEAAGDPEQESSWVDIFTVADRSSVRVASSHIGEVMGVVGWLDADTVALSGVVVEGGETVERAYVVNTDGSFFREIWKGHAIGVVSVD